MIRKKQYYSYGLFKLVKKIDPLKFNFILKLTNMDINELLFLGANKYGQAGIGQKYHNKTFTIPKSFAFPTFIKQISCGSHHSALLTIDGNIYTMGSNIHGALGSNPNLNYSFVPTLVEGLSQVTKIDCGPFHMCAISNGQLYSWGKGIDGQLGHGNTKNVSKPMKVEGLDRYVQEVSCGTNHTLVIVNSGKGDGSKIGYAFGNGIYGQLGNGQNKNSYIPLKIKLQSIDSIAAGENHSLFINKGNLYACGDNSNGQLGTVLNKKFAAEPTYVQIGEENEPHVKLIQAKKYSLALTDSGDMYIWGLKNNFGAPKVIRSSQKYEVQVIDIRVSNDQVYGLAAEGTLYCWGVKNGESKGNSYVCSKQKIVSNGRAVLDFSSGDNYILILGDIVKQIPYSSVAPAVLGCFDQIQQLVSHQRRQSNNSSGVTNSQRASIQSQLVHEIKDNKSSLIDSNLSDIELADSSMNNSEERNDFSKNFSKGKNNYDMSQLKPASMQGILPGLVQRKDFNNLKSNTSKNRDILTETKGGTTQGVSKEVKMDQNSESEIDHCQLIKTPSSSILCEPTNFLKESTRKQNYQIRKASIYETAFDQQSLTNEISMGKNLNWKKKKYSYSYLEEKENFPTQKNKNQTKKQKKFDRIMEMIEKSNHIGNKQSRDNLKINEDEWECQSEIVKSNRILRVQLRDKELKISQLQELLSRKEMEIEAQREIIKALRQKNQSNYASEQQ